MHVFHLSLLAVCFYDIILVRKGREDCVMSVNNDNVQHSELWEVSRRLVSFNTVSALSNVEAAEYLAGMLEDQGYTVRVLKETINTVEKANVVAWAGPEIPGGLILSGHIDVVPFEGQPGWHSNPLELHLEDH